MVTEPEAAAVFAARSLREDNKQDFLKVSVCKQAWVKVNRKHRRESASYYATLEVEQLYVLPTT